MASYERKYPQIRHLKQLFLDSFNSQGGLEVCISDQTTTPLLLPLVNKTGDTTLATTTELYGYTIEVVDPTGFAVGGFIRIIDTDLNKFYCSDILDVVGNTITLSTQLDNAYIAGSQVVTGSTNLAVDGSVTPVEYKLRLGNNSTEQTVDITGIVIQSIDDGAVDLNKFSGGPVLTRGILFRKTNHLVATNIFKAKDNYCLSGLTKDFRAYEATNPAQAVNGFIAKIDFAGQGNLGVAIRIEPDENLEMVVQDDLTEIIDLKVVVHGHVVKD